MPRITVHHLDDSRSQRVLWLLEELELDYGIERYERDRNMRAPRALREIHPLGKAPVVTVDDIVLAESGAVLETLVDEHGEGRLRPAPGTPASRRYRYWMHYAEGSLGPPLLVKLLMHRVRTGPVPFFLKPLVRRIADTVDDQFTDPELDLHLGFLEGHLDEHVWFAGPAFTAADIQMSFGLEASAARGLHRREDYPRLHAWLDRIHARPAYQRALERGGPYDYAG